MLLRELFNSGSFIVTDNSSSMFAVEADLSNGSTLNLICSKKYGPWNIMFVVDFTAGITNAGNEFEVFGIVMKALKQFMAEKKPKAMYFSSEEQSRTSLYKAFVRKYCTEYKQIESKTQGGALIFLYHEPVELQVRQLIGGGVRYDLPIFDDILSLEVHGDSAPPNKKIEKYMAKSSEIRSYITAAYGDLLDLS